MEWLLENVKGQSRSKVKATLQGRGVLVNGKVVTQFDAPLKPGMTVSVSKRKRDDELRSRYVRIVYEDPYLVVVEKNVGILSMQAGHSTLNVKSVLDDHFQKCGKHVRAHVVHRLDRDTSGLMIYAKDKQTAMDLEREIGSRIIRLILPIAAPWTMAASMPSPTTGYCAVAKTIRSWSSGWRQDAKTRYVSTPRIWGIPFAVTRSMAMAMTRATVSAFTLTCCAFTIP